MGIRIVVIVSLGTGIALFVSTLTGLVVCFSELGKTFRNTLVICLVAGWSYSVVGGYMDGFLRIRGYRVEVVARGSVAATKEA